MWPFKKKSKKDKLYAQYEQKLAEAHQMASINRSKSDQLIYEAEQILIQIDQEN